MHAEPGWDSEEKEEIRNEETNSIKMKIEPPLEKGIASIANFVFTFVQQELTFETERN